jgi:8-oxo-dGTP pyrophosphatase MutT (NUDIX family)
MIRKVFACVVREGSLLVFVDHHGNISIPKGTVEAGESLGTAVLRELHEESGVERGEILRVVGERSVQVHGGPEMNGPLEEQRHTGFLIAPPDTIPERWSHTVWGEGIDNGFVYHYEWLPITEELCGQLAYGADWFARLLLSADL